MTTSKTILHKCETERIELLGLNQTCGVSWPKIACLPKYQGIPMTSLYMWATGKRPLKDEHKRRLGIPYEVPAPACTACGKAHSIDRACEMKVVLKPKRVRTHKQPKRYPRFRAWLFEGYYRR